MALLMETVNASETSVNFYCSARRNIPEASRLYKHALLRFTSLVLFDLPCDPTTKIISFLESKSNAL
jgi:hypothetical protein